MQNKSKRRPTHRGELLREETLPAAGPTQTELTARLGISRRIIDLIFSPVRDQMFIEPENQTLSAPEEQKCATKNSHFTPPELNFL